MQPVFLVRLMPVVKKLVVQQGAPHQTPFITVQLPFLVQHQAVIRDGNRVIQRRRIPMLKITAHRLHLFPRQRRLRVLF